MCRPRWNCGKADEPFATLRVAPRCHIAPDAGHPPVRRDRISVPAALSATRSRLSDNSSSDLLSWREPGRDDLFGHCTARGPVRPDAESQSDELRQLGRRFGDHAAVRPEHQPGYCRAGGSGRHQRGGQLVAVGPAGTADICQGQSGRCPDPHTRADIKDAPAAADRGSRRHAPRAKNLAASWRKRFRNCLASGW